MAKICVLQPDYSTSDVDYKQYDPPRNLSSLLPGQQVDHIFLNKLTTYHQLKNLKQKGYDIFINLCEGYLDWSLPSIDVIHSLELLNLPYTGPNAILYDPPKELMKYVAYTCGVKTPAYQLVKQGISLNEITQNIAFPVFIKPAKAGDSLGIDENSLLYNGDQLENKITSLLEEYEDVLVEEYIDGRELTVLVAKDAGKGNACTVYEPIDYIFPQGRKFKTYSLKTSELHTECNIPCKDASLSESLKQAASAIFKAFNGVGYARLDFRVNDNREIYFLEINFTCSVFYEDGYEGSADYILMNDPNGKEGFLQKIISEGIFRHRQKQKKYFLKQHGISGYGIYASQPILPGEVIFNLEEKAHRLVSKKHVEENWSEEEKDNFRKYAYPISDEIYVMWDENPSEWAPQNHSCNPNTEYRGLNVVAVTAIRQGEELTLDYAKFSNSEMQSFMCNCGAPDCRKIIQAKEKAVSAFKQEL